MKRMVSIAIVLVLGLVYWVWLAPGQLIVRTIPAEVQVSLDGETVGATSGQGLIVQVGRGSHLLRLERDGFEAVEQEIVVSGDSVVVVRTLAPSGMIYIAGGVFTMGDDEGAYSERPAHRVSLRSYYVDRTEVAIASFKAFRPGYVSPFDDDQFPATNVSWGDAAAFCAWNGKRLPSEAEWERACRGSGDHAYSYGDLFDSSAARVGGALESGPVKVGHQAVGLEGTFDLTGNVWEWCADWYDRKAYREGERENPSGPLTGSRRVLRGGAWYSNERFSKCTHRPGNFRAVKDPSFGFRCAKDVLSDERDLRG